MTEKPKKVLRKKREQVEEEAIKRETRRAEQKVNKDKFIRHWEQSDSDPKDKKIDGNRRPRPFNYNIKDHPLENFDIDDCDDKKSDNQD